MSASTVRSWTCGRARRFSTSLEKTSTSFEKTTPRFPTPQKGSKTASPARDAAKRIENGLPPARDAAKRVENGLSRSAAAPRPPRRACAV